MNSATDVTKAAQARAEYFARCEALREKLFNLGLEFERDAVPTLSQAREIGHMLERLAFMLPSEHGFGPDRFNVSITIAPYR